MGVQLELNKVADVSIDEAVRRQSVLYLSRGQLRKHTSTILNFSLNINYISQQVCNHYLNFYNLNSLICFNFKVAIDQKFMNYLTSI